ncbi:MAG: Rpn family recombination-promoting nuclease/putative transposase [Acaryochloridaceae cyanobacterium RU_4_10]|nr:Rpn family recombination-promoting nuclease/putative transposase [Acaryochloridaceae cyanobacterium RU_4_10]
MKTDSIFYKIFQTDPGILFELLGRSPDLANSYDFSSVEIKQVAFRIDGVFLPKLDSNDKTVWFVEVQFGRDPKFYGRFFGEIYFYLDLHQDTQDWQAVVIFPKRSIEPRQRHLYRANLASDQVHRIYLDELTDVPTESFGVGLMQLILADSEDAVSQAQALLNKTNAQGQTNSKIAAIIEIIETILIYKFPLLGREEIERMLGLGELRETKVYQEALHEGRQEGEQAGILKGEQTLILRQLTRRIAKVAPELQEQVQSLSLAQLESLSEALLDFTSAKDLSLWLQQNS